jgi:hypothetical protein
VLLDHPLRGNRLEVKLGRHVPIANPNDPPDFLVFFDVEKGQLDCFSGREAGPAVVPYLQGLLALDATDEAKRLRYCFDFLEHPDSTIANDAERELQIPAEAQLVKAGRAFPAARLRGWLRNPRTPVSRLRLYGLLLCTCGNRGDAALLRAVVARETRGEPASSIDGLLIGWTLLDPAGGWAQVRTLLDRPSSVFSVRYAALKAACFLQENRPEVIGKKKFQEALSLVLAQGDIADLAIHALRRCRCWDLTGHVLALHGKRSHAAPLMRRALLSYAMQCPLPEAAVFIDRQRRADGKMIEEIAELLKLE